jgi:hypothetical protein
MRLRHLILASAVTLVLPVAALGTTIQVTGSVTAITNDTASLTLDGSVAVGTTYTASYTYDPNLVDPFATPQDATYSPLATFQIVLGDYVIVPARAAAARSASRMTSPSTATSIRPVLGKQRFKRAASAVRPTRSAASL